jgi:hypothetical protein
MHYSLLNSVINRRLFDPAKDEDLAELKHFIDTNQWINNCPFYLEEYWDNIPAMCMHKYAHHMLSKFKLSKQKTKSPK